MKSKEYKEVLNALAQMLGEGVHIVDGNGKTIVYNEAMERLEQTDRKKVLGKPFDKVFGGIPKDESTIRKALLKRKPTILAEQVYTIQENREIHTVNSTVPVIVDDRVVAVIETASASNKVSESKNQNDKKVYKFSDLIHKSRIMKKQIAIARKAAKSDASITICGDVGTGKELIAKTIHFESNRKNGVFLSQRCRGISEKRLDDMLFGRENAKGTGYENALGLLEAGRGGTVFLDELESIPYELQGKLLRALQERYICRNGGRQVVPINVRVIGAIGDNPTALMEKGLLRKELFYRLGGLTISLPNLSDRREDIVPIFEMFLKRECQFMNRAVPRLSYEAMEKLESHIYHGNVRELENIVVSTLISLGNKGLIRDRDIVFRGYDKKAYSAIIGYYSEKESLDSFILNMERRIIWEAMERNANNISKTAAELGMKRQTLQHKLKKYGHKI